MNGIDVKLRKERGSPQKLGTIADTTVSNGAEKSDSSKLDASGK
jgi:hypothetical protein